MPLRGLVRLAVILTIATVLNTRNGFGQSPRNQLAADRHEAISATSLNPTWPAAHAVPLRPYVAPEFVGQYRPDGRFKKRAALAPSSAGALSLDSVRQDAVPSYIDLRPVERVVEDYEPPGHAMRAAKGHSLFATLRDGLVTLAYGRERVLRAPTHVTTDSRQRLIVTDPDLPAVHVLDLERKKSFRIAAGPQYRLRAPTGVAVDGEDNIYVADGKRGTILVYDPQGRFLRYIGSFRGESLFQSPAGIAIDRNARRLYVLDPPVQQLVMLDLGGAVLKRVGDKRSPSTATNPDHPIEIAVDKDHVVVLDSGGSRIQVFDLQCNFLGTFLVANLGDPTAFREIGLALDSASNIYLSNLNGSLVQVYDPAGHSMGAFGRSGLNAGEFNRPSGMWIDAYDRVYVADTWNSRIQVFRAVVSSQKAEGIPSGTVSNGH
jgi:sugar lactone lactonase YvrE